MVLSRVLHTPGRLRDSANELENSNAFDRRSSNVESVMIELVFCHRILDSITITSTVSLNTSTEFGIGCLNWDSDGETEIW
ncbi:MAG: hypothetical protein RL069_529 [Planctomycetota bacterium]